MKNNKNSKINNSGKKPIDLGVNSKSLGKKGGYRVVKLIDAFELDIQNQK